MSSTISTGVATVNTGSGELASTATAILEGTGLPMFWPLPSAFLGSAAAAGGLALINSVGQIAGFISPFLVGWIKDTTHSTDPALYILSGVMFVGALLVLGVPARLVNR